MAIVRRICARVCSGATAEKEAGKRQQGQGYSVVIGMDVWYNFNTEEIEVNGAAGERTERQRNERSDRE